MASPSIRESQRASRTCVECGRRKIKCDKKIPCAPCVRRNLAHECRRPITRVRGQLQIGSDVAETPALIDDDAFSTLLKERSALKAQIAKLEIALALSKPGSTRDIVANANEQASEDDFDDLGPALEQFDLDVKYDPNSSPALRQLWAPADDPLYMLLPTRNASQKLIHFALSTFGWMHCAVRADVFLKQHDDFWTHLEAGQPVVEEQRPWLALWLSLLAIGLMYIDINQIPDRSDLPNDIISDPVDNLAYAIDVSRMWYEASLQELHRIGFLRTPRIESVQTILVLTLCNSNNGDHQQEWVMLGACINMARAMDMHRLGTEQSFDKRLVSRPEWATPGNRELGRRLWWNIVVCDWLSAWSRPPSISPSLFCCTLSGQSPYDFEVLPSQTRSTSSSTPSPVLYLATMGQLSYIFYIYFKANANRSTMKSVKALEEIEAARKSLPLHLSQNFPGNADDANWESMHPWVTSQRHQLATVFDFFVLSITRSMAFTGTEEHRSKYRSSATDAARRILLRFTATIPRFHQLLWSSSASAVASGIFLALEYILSQDSPQPRGTEYLQDLLPLVYNTIDILDKNAQVTIHAEKGVGILRQIWSLCQQWHIGTGGLSAQSILSQFVHNRSDSISSEGLDYANFVFPDLLSDMMIDSNQLLFRDDEMIASDLDASMSIYDLGIMK